VNYAKFKIAFWHPFGPAALETPEQIIRRKCKEIEQNGWTLWSFRHRLMLNDWHRKLLSAKRNAVFVFCSDSPRAEDPARKKGTRSKSIDCQSYRFVGDKDTRWRPMPKGVSVPHPFRPSKKQKLASAFVVKRIIFPVKPFDGPAVEWFSLNKGPWRQERVPTHGEHLIRRGGGIAMRRVRMVLELKPPYDLAVVTPDKADRIRISN
jgi:hypothetical protein